MKNLNKTAIGIAISLTLGFATAAYANPGQMGGNMEHGAQQDQHQGMQGGMGHGQKHGMQGGQHQSMHGGMGMGHGQKPGMNQGAGKGHGNHGSNAAQSLATPEERAAMQEKMRAAKTPEERLQIASANRAEMQKRATEKGITMPEHRGPQGRNAPANTEHKH